LRANLGAECGPGEPARSIEGVERSIEKLKLLVDSLKLVLSSGDNQVVNALREESEHTPLTTANETVFASPPKKDTSSASMVTCVRFESG
jgi:hypothetical protein